MDTKNKNGEPSTSDYLDDSEIAKNNSLVTEKLIECPHCDYISTGAANLQQHMRIHGKTDDMCDDKETDDSLKPNLAHIAETSYENGLSDYTTEVHAFNHQLERMAKTSNVYGMCDYILPHANFFNTQNSNTTLNFPNINYSNRPDVNTEANSFNTFDYKAAQSNLKQPNVKAKRKQFEANCKPVTPVFKKPKKVYECSECDYKTTHASNMKHHQLTHTGEKPYKCDQCDYRTAYSTNLKHHRLDHSGVKPFGCDLCDYRTKKADHLKRHKLTHTGQKPYECDICGYKTAHSNNLKHHKLTHTGQKPYQCDKCDFRSAHASNLKQHKLIHSEKMHKCDICDFRTAYASSLKSHRITHFIERSYECDMCDFKATHVSAYKAHMLKHPEEYRLRPQHEMSTQSEENSYEDGMLITDNQMINSGGTSYDSNETNIHKSEHLTITDPGQKACEGDTVKSEPSEEKTFQSVMIKIERIDESDNLIKLEHQSFDEAT